jgi:Flp pilus assembly protein protease CpaA
VKPQPSGSDDRSGVAVFPRRQDSRIVRELTLHMPMLALLIWAAGIDLRSRRIPNWLNLLLIVSGFAQSFLPARTVSPGQSLLGMFVAAAVPFILFAIGAIGAGDVKLMAGIGTWLGPWPALGVLIVEKVLGLIIVLVQAAVQGRTRVLLRNSAVVTVNLLYVKDVGVDAVMKTGSGCRSISQPLPFAVPAFLAVVIVLVALGSHQ